MNVKSMILSVLLGVALTSACLVASAEESQGADQDQAPPADCPHHPPKLTEAQRTCVEGILGKPGEGDRPSREQMHAAFKTCNVQPPWKRAAASNSGSTTTNDASE